MALCSERSRKEQLTELRSPCLCFIITQFSRERILFEFHNIRSMFPMQLCAQRILYQMEMKARGAEFVLSAVVYRSRSAEK